MKGNKFAYSSVVFVVLVTLFLSTACGVVDRGVKERDQLITELNEGYTAQANCFLTVDVEYGKMQTTMSTAESYYKATNHNVESWAKAFRPQQKEFEDMQGQYQGVISDPSDPGFMKKMNDLGEKGLTPDKVASGFSLFVNAVQQAPAPLPDSKVTLGVLDTVNEAYNTITASCRDMNKAANVYNTHRGRVSGALVGEVSAKLGFPIPEKLSLYQGANTGPIRSVATPKP